MGDMHDHHIPPLPDEDDYLGVLGEQMRNYIMPTEMAVSKAEARARMDRAQHLSREKDRSFRTGAWVGFFTGACMTALAHWIW